MSTASVSPRKEVLKVFEEQEKLLAHLKVGAIAQMIAAVVGAYFFNIFSSLGAFLLGGAVLATNFLVSGMIFSLVRQHQKAVEAEWVCPLKDDGVEELP